MALRIRVGLCVDISLFNRTTGQLDSRLGDRRLSVLIRINKHPTELRPDTFPMLVCIVTPEEFLVAIR